VVRTWKEALLPAWEYYNDRRAPNGAGGWLHIALDDGNLERGNIQFCHDQAVENNDPAGASLARLLLDMSYTQRAKLYANYDLYCLGADRPEEKS